MNLKALLLLVLVSFMAIQIGQVEGMKQGCAFSRFFLIM